VLINHLPVIAPYFVGFLSAFVLSVGLTYAVREGARRAGLFDPVDERKLHTRPIPRVGGVAVFASAAIALLVVVTLMGEGIGNFGGPGLRAIVLGAGAMHLLGLWDDLRPMPARFKLAGQVAIAVAVWATGVRVTSLALPFVGVVEFGSYVGLAFTVFWLVGITNAFNLIDGLDGLASGAALFALTTMFVVGTVNGQNGSALVTLVVAGAVIGFLIYNWHPASIFLGDSGSLFLGFTLAGMGLVSSQKGSTMVAVAIPLVSLGLPVLDTSIAIVRRFLRGQPIFTADRGHIHHRMLSLGHSPRDVALLMYGACAVLALSGMLMVNNTLFVALFLTIVGLGFGLWLQKLRFHEFEELARVVRKGFRQRDVIARRVRIREASSQLALANDLERVFETMDNCFAADQFRRVEIRLLPAFLQNVSPLRDLDEHRAGRRRDDDVTVWSWDGTAGLTSTAGQSSTRTVASTLGWWEIRLPLADQTGARMGSLVLWHDDGAAGETSISHMHVIAGEFRAQVQRKLLDLWPRAAEDALAPVLEQEVERVISLVVGANLQARGRALGKKERAYDSRDSTSAA
jgi:UDP-GlcNAc:undecaprenyl-phosphate GlcNAc-1-phosphate transferase